MRTCLIIAAILMLFPVVGCKKEGDKSAERSKAEAQTALAKADDTWAAGHQSEAVDAYMALVNDHLLDFEKSDQARVFTRIIDTRIKQSGPDAASDYMQQAILFNIPLALTTPEANQALAKERQKSKTNGSAWTDSAAADKFEKSVDAMEPKADAAKGKGGGGGMPAFNPTIETEQQYRNRLNPTHSAAVDGMINGGTYNPAAANNMRRLEEIQKGQSQGK
jgi:hypothetical protein